MSCDRCGTSIPIIGKDDERYGNKSHFGGVELRLEVRGKWEKLGLLVTQGPGAGEHVNPLTYEILKLDFCDKCAAKILGFIVTREVPK